MIASHPPEVLRELAHRCGRETYARRAAELRGPVTIDPSTPVHYLTRDELELAIGADVLEVDRPTTLRLEGAARVLEEMTTGSAPGASICACGDPQYKHGRGVGRCANPACGCTRFVRAPR